MSLLAQKLALLVSTKYQLSLLDPKSGGGKWLSAPCESGGGGIAPPPPVPTPLQCLFSAQRVSKIYFMKTLTWISWTWFDPVLKFVILIHWCTVYQNILEYYHCFWPQILEMLWYDLIFCCRLTYLSLHLLIHPKLMVTDPHTHPLNHICTSIMLLHLLIIYLLCLIFN